MESLISVAIPQLYHSFFQLASYIYITKASSFLPLLPLAARWDERASPDRLYKSIWHSAKKRGAAAPLKSINKEHAASCGVLFKKYKLTEGINRTFSCSYEPLQTSASASGWG
jgi:hypothetical protein